MVKPPRIGHLLVGPVKSKCAMEPRRRPLFRVLDDITGLEVAALEGGHLDDLRDALWRDQVAVVRHDEARRPLIELRPKAHVRGTRDPRSTDDVHPRLDAVESEALSLLGIGRLERDRKALALYEESDLKIF